MSDCKHEAALRRIAWLLGGIPEPTPESVIVTAADHIIDQRAEIAGLTLELDEARAVLADLGGDHEALKPYAPTGWRFCDLPFKHCWIGPNGEQVFAAIAGDKRGALAAMRAADKALATEAAQ